MNPIITDALTTAGRVSNAVSSWLRHDKYTVYPDGIAPDDRAAMFFLADALVEDATEKCALSDRHILHSSAHDLAAKHAARARMERRTAITDALLDLSREDRIALIDALADGRTVIAA